MKKFNAIDCFSGAGGLSLGFKNNDYNIIYAFDNDEDAINTYKHNIGSHAEVCDIHDVDKSHLKKILNKRIGEIDVIFGGPPCQGFSVQRRGDDVDKRNDLVLEYIRLVLEIRPKFFLMENVQGLLSKRGQPIMEQLNKKCMKAGYFLHIRKLNAYDYGVPQNRKRVMIVGELAESGLPQFSFPEGGRDIYSGPATVREAIEDISALDECDLPNHKADKLSEINLRRIRAISAGQGRDALPEELQLECHRRNKSHRHLDTYGRMEWDKPGPTITARFDSFSRGRFGHPINDRTITLREGARLQTFPDDFEFLGNKVSVAKQIGNAVPPNLSEAIAQQIKRYL